VGNNHGKIKTMTAMEKQDQMFFRSKLGKPSNGSFATSILGYFRRT
jgi:hypothetical protein